MESGNKAESFVLPGAIKGEIRTRISLATTDFAAIDMFPAYGRMNRDKVTRIFPRLKNFACFYSGFDWLSVLLQFVLIGRCK